MDIQSIVDSFLSSGRELASQGRELAEKGLGLSDNPDERKAKLKTLGTGAAVGGVLALMLGTKKGRRFGGKALAYGSLAALAGVAYKAYQSWTDGDEESKPVTELSGTAAQDRAVLLLRGMIAAANADGLIDEAEKRRIQDEMEDLDVEEGLRNMLVKEINHPLPIRELTELATCRAAATELFTISSIVIDEANEAETRYLGELASALKIPDAVVTQIRSHA